MLSDTAHLALMLDAPLMSFGHASRFQRRTTALHPTRSAITGMICAAAGAGKGSPAEGEWLERLGPRHVRLLVFAIPRRPDGSRAALPILRWEDFHTVLGTRRASGKINTDAVAVISYRQYLMDARFGVVLSGPRATLEAAAEALRDPRWGIWFGRKSCIPAAPVVRALAATEPEAVTALVPGVTSPEGFDAVTDAPSFAAGTDTLMDVPLDFGRRQFAPRRIAVQPGRK
ncbi:MAG: type I-E CRISPR-associated protein Cas5/CasD [Lentisphaeria bacterium]|nr:type I-E CRISPR-associated protein Cas5/CasD [Lentisphaeria bacterium]